MVYRRQEEKCHTVFENNDDVCYGFIVMLLAFAWFDSGRTTAAAARR